MNRRQRHFPVFLSHPMRWAAAGRLRILRPSNEHGLFAAIRRNLPNAVSLAGVLPLCILLTPGSFSFVPLLIVVNNVMDDLDGMLARGLNVATHFGFRLDNVCDAVAHTLITMIVGAQFGSWTLAAATAPSAAIILRMTSRLRPEGPNGLGSTTNELMRHILFLLLGARAFHLNVRGALIVVFLAHAVTLIAPMPMPHLLRSRARGVWAVAAVNAALVVALVAPMVMPIIALPFVASYLSSFWVGLFGRRPQLHAVEVTEPKV